MTQDYSYEDKLALKELTRNPSSQGKSEEVPINKEVIEYIKARAPPKSVYEKLVFFLNRGRGQIAFVVDDLKGKMYFPGKESDRYDIPYFDTVSKNKDGFPTYYIHLTKSYFDAKLKLNTEAQARLVVQFYAERFLASPYQRTRHELGWEKGKALIHPSGKGLYLDKKRQSQLDKAVEDEDQGYLFKLIDTYDIRKDPDRIYQQAIYEAVSKLPEINITTGRDLLAWHRYMLESNIREQEDWPIDQIIPNISNIIREAVSKKGAKMGSSRINIEKTLIYKTNAVDINEKKLSRYKRKYLFPYKCRYLFPYKRSGYFDDAVIFIPECPTNLSKNIFKKVSLNEKSDNKKSLRVFAKAIRELASKECILTEGIETGLSNLDTIEVIQRILERATSIIKHRRARGGKRAVVIGVLGPGCSGKTTFSEVLTLASKVKKLKSGYFGCDGSLLPGEGLRYDEKKGKYREVHIWGPAIYNDTEIYRAINHLKEGNALTKPPDKHGKKKAGEIGPNLAVVISDGVFIGMDKDVSDIIDIFVAINVDESDAPRLKIKLERDKDKESTHKGTHIPLDFSEKQFHETRDGLRTLILERADFVWLRESHAVYIRKESYAKPMKPGDFC